MRRISFGSIEARPQNREQVQKMSQIAYKTKETMKLRYGTDQPVLMRANITQDTVTFKSTKENSAKEKTVEGIMAFYLRKANIPFKQV